MNELLRITGLSKSFGRRSVFRDLNLAMNAGRVYGFLGKNGEGKTTLVRILMGIIPADSGEIHYKEAPVSFRSAGYKEEFGYIPEDPFFFGGMKVGEFLDFNAAFYRRWDGGRVDELLGRFSLDKKARIRTLSRGMKLKLEMATALAANPSVLILDDPTSGLDVPTRHDFLQGIVRELADSGTMILFATHLVHELERIVDHLFILEGGRIILDEEYEAVKNSTRRVRLDLEDQLPEGFGIDGILTESREGRRVEMVIYPWSEDKKQKIESLAPRNLEIEPLSLEDIFRSFVAR
ncbi:MAG: ABC transporter ATP-binding protein [Candidatus Aminicenantes bacterium]|nr:ABC transporter ATP-binding protein [Candidatus Aminicenantes bacterium]